LSARVRHLCLLLIVLFASGCGVRFRDDFRGTELFKSIVLEGERVAGATLEVTVGLNHGYPVPIQIACFYEDGSKLTDDQLKLAFHERATPIGEEVLPPVFGRKPDDEVERTEVSFRFSVEEPGDYFVACLTPAAPDNGLGRSFTISEPTSGSAP
jgi:hypothetical protein